MKHIYFMLFSAMLLLVGCNKEKQNSGPSGFDETDDYVYMDMTMQLPVAAGTRSVTDWDDENNPGNGDSNSDADPDTEDGLDYENTVKTVLLVLANSQGKFISYSEVAGAITKGAAVGEYSIKAKFKRDDIDAAYAEGGALYESNKVKIYAYVNYTDNLHRLFSAISDDDKEGAWLDWSGEIIERPSKAGSTPVISNTIWAKHSFLMTNSSEFEAKFPDSADDWDDYADSGSPFKIEQEDGVINVERCAARIDYKDVSDGNNTYSILGGLTSSGGSTSLNLINVQLTRMSLVNMSKNFYYLRRVANGYEDKNPRIGKYETRTNYVVDTDWDAKYENSIRPENADTYFNFPLYGEKHDGDEYDAHYAYGREGWYTDNIADIVAEGTTMDNYKDHEYHVWRYVTENTCPSVEDQTTVQTTGIIFKGLILPGENIDAVIGAKEDSPRYISEAVEKALVASKYHLPMAGSEGASAARWDGIAALDNDSKLTLSYDYPVCYEFDGLLYAGFDAVVNYAATEGEGSLIYSAVQSILGHWILDGTTFKLPENEVNANGTKLTIRIFNEIRNGVAHVDDGSVDYTPGEGKTEYEIDLVESDLRFKAYVTSGAEDAGKFTIYEVSFEDTETEKGEGWGYYCYYFYWNRHNDNGYNGKMGPMEFAIVRNNVYKLSVETINRLGHPRNPDNDPDPFDPDDPDEDSRVYLNVDLKVIPWVVRENKITF